MKNRLKFGPFSRLTGFGDATMVRALQGGPRSQKGRFGRLVASVFPQIGEAGRGKWARSSAVEHLTFNQRVDGSIPSGLTTSLRDRRMIANPPVNAMPGAAL